MRHKNSTRITMLKPRVAMLDGRTARPAPKTGDPFYDSREWRALKAQIIKARGRRCEDLQCETPNGPWSQIYGDHIVELQDGGAPLDPANVMLLCPACHTRKTTEQRAKRMAQRFSP